MVYGIATRSLEKIGSNDCPTKGIKISGLPDLFLVGFLGGTNFTPFKDSGIYTVYIHLVYMEPKWVPLFCLECMPWFGEKKTSQKLVGHGWVTDAKKTWGDPCDSANGQPYLFHPLIYTSGGIYCAFSLTQWPTFRLLVIPYQGVIKFPFFGGIKQYKSRVILRDDFPTMHGLGW